MKRRQERSLKISAVRGKLNAAVRPLQTQARRRLRSLGNCKYKERLTSLPPSFLARIRKSKKGEEANNADLQRQRGGTMSGSILDV